MSSKNCLIRFIFKPILYSLSSAKCYGLLNRAARAATEQGCQIGRKACKMQLK